MTSTPSPHQVFDLLISGISAHRWHDLADLYTEDAVVEIPFTIPEPIRLQGREMIRRHFAAAASGPLTLTAGSVVVHETADPNVVVAEFDYTGHVSSTGRSFRAANIQVLGARDGLIAWSRDYHDHRAIAEALRPPAVDPTTLIHRMYEAFNTRDLGAVDDLFAAGFISHPLRSSGVACVKDAWTRLHTTYPQIAVEVEEVIATVSKVVVRSTLRGVSQLDPAPTMMEIIRVEDGKIAEVWGVSSLGH
jgi:ketosteroid isomerase-like protein/predicted SnoaL-like aldol condensation-catalyzing enzyme